MENLYKFRRAIRKNLKMNGSFGESDRFILSEAFEIQEGDRITFGPMRLAQAVMGYFFDEENQPLMLINHTNIEIAHTFEEGMVMASILAPKAAAVRLQLTLAEKDLFCIYINEEICIDELPPERYLSNPLKGRNVLTIGDSLCDAAREPKVAGMRGWARRIWDAYDACVFNAGIGGAAFSNCRLGRPRTTEWHQICRQVHRYPEYEYDYILLEGGANDCRGEAAIGQVSESFDPATFDPTTYAGGLELLIYEAVKTYGDTAAIGYMSMYKTNHPARSISLEDYFKVGKKICEKWGIEYLDMYNELEFDTVTLTVDGGHANKEGYDYLAPYINPFMLKIRPVPYKIRKAVLGEE